MCKIFQVIISLKNFRSNHYAVERWLNLVSCVHPSLRWSITRNLLMTTCQVNFRLLWLAQLWHGSREIQVWANWKRWIVKLKGSPRSSQRKRTKLRLVRRRNGLMKSKVSTTRWGGIDRRGWEGGGWSRQGLLVSQKLVLSQPQRVDP